ncbi:MAG TPA: preprotein translocase subunit YajC [Phycisphaeraceae bacterium]
MPFESIPLILAQDDQAPPPPNLPQQTADGPPAAVEGQSGAPVQQQPQQQQPPPSPFGFGSILWLIALIVLFYVLIFGSQRRERRKREAMLKALKKGDKVQTVGGILGTVLDVRDNEVVVKVDESSNTRLRFSRSAIQAVLQEADKE